MITPRPARKLFRAEMVSLAFAALLVAGLPLAAQQRSRPSDSSDAGRTAHDAGSSHNSTPSPPTYNPPSRSEGGNSSGSSTSGSDSPRRAVPGTPGEADRQPSHRRGDGRGGHRGHGGHGGFYDPYYPYGYGWYGRGWWGWGWWNDYPYYPHGEPAYYGRDEVGALDLDVSPGRTEVWLDGEYVGKVDAFDGWPRFLWLPKGTYDVVLYLDGYETIARQITVRPGLVIDIDDRMEPGESKRPEDLVSKSHERRDERESYERERRRRIEDQEASGDEDWRDRVRRERGPRRDDWEDRDGRAREEEPSDERSSEGGRLRLDIEPEDASVYLDGRFVGTGTEISMMRAGLPIEPGDHKLAVVRPGHKARELDFSVEAGEDVDLNIELEESGSR